MRAIDHTTLHRTAKYFMDSGRAESPEEALRLLQSFGLAIMVSAAAAASYEGQVALLTLVNLARRTFLAGVEVVNLPDVARIAPLADAATLQGAVIELGGQVTQSRHGQWPLAVIGDDSAFPATGTGWRLVWEGWRAGVVPLREKPLPFMSPAMELAPAMAAAVCAAELFAFHAGNHPLAGKRRAGLSLWQPGADWTTAAADEPALAYLPSRLWLIGLGNLGQAYSWLLACLRYEDPSQVELVLQDFDRLAESNDSTSMLACLDAIGKMKTRWVAEWLERRGFHTALEERRFGLWTQRQEWEPPVALCGVDNGLARASLEKAGFELVVESGLGAGPQGFRNFSLHSFPSSRRAEQIWSGTQGTHAPDVSSMPAYAGLRKRGMDQCGLAQLASRTVGVPFVGLIAGGFVIAELLRRLHGGQAYGVIAGSAASLSDIEASAIEVEPYGYGYATAESLDQGEKG
ncbi:MAG: thiamine biosynthesis protein ThiF [Alphaproteobacteria bacterium]|nr:thiamine biosynthesis protein ThiF [Alphaproteobacteria bacterium]MBV9371028.1 thiamine biosynthesis protein ThiF [Alphaproteobacteria bacterium]MBV9901598.1 thiamine biosynthesis protein ThiF [Alphaproteobacteria bacterium]